MIDRLHDEGVDRPVLVFMALTGLAAILYFQALDHPFHYDDHHSVQYNPHTRSLSNVPSFFVDPGTFSSHPSGFMYRPILLITYALNHFVMGQQVQGYRIVNLFLHIIASFAVYLIARRLFASREIAIGAGFVFLCHPMHSELVHYISSRSGLLAATCFLVGFASLIGDTKPRHRAAITASAYMFGLLAKSIAITLPFVLVLLNFCRYGARQAVTRIQRYWYLWLAAGVYLAVIWANRFLVNSLEGRPRSFSTQAWTQLKALVYYLKLTLFPANASIEHQFSVATSALTPEVLLALALLVSITIVAAVAFRRTLLFCWGWFIITLAPASVMPLNILVSERRMYLASAGLLLAACWLWQRSTMRTGPASRQINALGIAVVVVFCVLNLQRNQVWADDVSLWEDAVSKAPAMHRARLNLGLAYEREGRVEDALREFEHGLRLKPDSAEAWNAVGNLHKSRGDVNGAEIAYRKALKYNSNFPGVYYNLGNLRQRSGDLDEAVRYFESALELDAHFVLARNNLGQAFEAAQRYEAAAQQYELAVRDSLYWKDVRDPELGGAWFNLAGVRERLGDMEGARVGFVRARDLLDGHEDYASFSARAIEAADRLARERAKP
jgi:tetratricopeptide (TPR) repeat protein